MMNRRTLTLGISAIGLTSALPTVADTPAKTVLTLKSNTPIPPIGMGTWLTFNVPTSGPKFEARKRVLTEFFAQGGGMIDSSPMYGRSEAAIGAMRADLQEKGKLFSATKIWTPMAGNGPVQLSNSHKLWNKKVLDLVHVHNLLRWEAHLGTLRAAKEAGSVRYIGLTTSHGRRHEALERLIRTEPVDAVQFSYNILRLLPAARDQGLTVIINRPFMTGRLFDRVKTRAVPEWAREELDIRSWAEYFLKFVISHPAVTCAIPATRQVDHMKENMRAGRGVMPDAAQRRRMVEEFEIL